MTTDPPARRPPRHRCRRCGYTLAATSMWHSIDPGLRGWYCRNEAACAERAADRKGRPMTTDPIAAHVREAWDDAVLALAVHRPGMTGDEFLAAVIAATTDAMARLKERGLIV